MAEMVSYRTFDSACRRAEKRSMKLNGCCSTCIGQNCFLIKHGARIVETQPDRKMMIIEGDWRTALKKAAESAGNAPPKKAGM
jgi:hypothetical protein